MAWSTQSPMSESKEQIAGCGTALSSLAIGGYSSPSTFFDTVEKWNGTTWATTTAISGHDPSRTPGNRSGAAAVGSVMSALVFGGTSSGGDVNWTDEWNGSAWTTRGGMLPSSMKNHIGMGDTFYAIAVLGNTCLAWTGAIWGSTTGLNSGDHNDGPAGCGRYNNAIVFGGQYSGLGPPSEITERWNGSSWSTTSNMGTRRQHHSGIGSFYHSLACGGLGQYGGGSVELKSTCEKLNGSTWSTVPSMGGTRAFAGSSSRSAFDALIFGGYTLASPRTVTGSTERFQIDEEVFLSGTVKIRNYPATRKVRLYTKDDGEYVKEVWSDKNDGGAYEVGVSNEDIDYFILAIPDAP